MVHIMRKCLREYADIVAPDEHAYSCLFVHVGPLHSFLRCWGHHFLRYSKYGMATDQTVFNKTKQPIPCDPVASYGKSHHHRA